VLIVTSVTAIRARREY